MSYPDQTLSWEERTEMEYGIIDWDILSRARELQRARAH
jgi:hypothetical protein